MFTKVLLALLIALAFVAVLISMQPATYRVVRNITIDVPPAAIYTQISDFHNWNAWSPWAKLDPNMKQTFDGPPAGVGAAYSWQGNKEAGEGRMAITEAVPGDRVAIDLQFLKPFPSTSTIRFTLRPEGTGTSVLWDMEGTTTFASKAIELFYGMDKMVGPDFERGLAQLKTVSEAANRSESSR
jgi:uncharacterized protein YndB with AHSA1/START domain